MFCSKCGSANGEGSGFCTVFGAPLGPPNAGVPAPGAPAPAAYPPVAPPPPPKKKRGCVIALVVLGALLLCCFGSAAGVFFGVVSLGKPRDLGVRYSEKDYKSAIAKLGIDVSQAGPDSPTARAAAQTAGAGEPGAAGSAAGGTGAGAPGGAVSGGAPAGAVSGGATGGKPASSASGGTRRGSKPVTQGPAKGTMVVYEGTRPIDITLTSEEFSALMSMYHYSPNWIVQDLQVKFGDDGTIELSGYALYNGQMYPGYAMATGQLTGPKSVGGSISVLEGIGVEVPQEYCGPAAEYIAGMMNEWLGQMDGLNLTSATVDGGQLHLVGSVPARVVRVPAQ